MPKTHAPVDHFKKSWADPAPARSKSPRALKAANFGDWLLCLLAAVTVGIVIGLLMSALGQSLPR